MSPVERRRLKRAKQRVAERIGPRGFALTFNFRLINADTDLDQARKRATRSLYDFIRRHLPGLRLIGYWETARQDDGLLNLHLHATASHPTMNRREVSKTIRSHYRKIGQVLAASALYTSEAWDVEGWIRYCTVLKNWSGRLVRIGANGVTAEDMSRESFQETPHDAVDDALTIQAHIIHSIQARAQGLHQHADGGRKGRANSPPFIPLSLEEIRKQIVARSELADRTAARNLAHRHRHWCRSSVLSREGWSKRTIQKYMPEHDALWPTNRGYAKLYSMDRVRQIEMNAEWKRDRRLVEKRRAAVPRGRSEKRSEDSRRPEYLFR